MHSEEAREEFSGEVSRAYVLKKSIEQKSVDESRRFNRYPCILAVTLDWKNKRGKQTFAEGLTRDISAGGIFAHTNQCPPVGTIVHYRVFLPAVHRMGRNVRITGSGKVVRVERLDGRWHGVAVHFDKQMIRVTEPRVATGSNAADEHSDFFESCLPRTRA
jgi:hypothetical protein